MEDRVVDREVMSMVDTSQMICVAVFNEWRTISAIVSSYFGSTLSIGSLLVVHDHVQSHESHKTRDRQDDAIPVE
jgi:hypothetical protein